MAHQNGTKSTKRALCWIAVSVYSFLSVRTILREQTYSHGGIMTKRKNKQHILKHPTYILCLLLLLTFAACSSANTTNQATTNANHNTNTGASTGATPTQTPTIQLGPQPCPVAVSMTTYWDPLIPTQPGINKVESITCAYLIGQPILQALVTVRSQSAGSVLDVYVYNQITSPTPVQLFKLQGLYKGEAKISGYNTVLTGEADQNSRVNKNATIPNGLTVDLFREFKWSDGAKTLVPVSFPGLYPDLTRYQAENDQQQVNQGQNGWMLSAGTVAQNLAINLLQWPNNVVTTVVHDGGKSDVDAVVIVKNPQPGGGIIQVILNRLEGNTNGGIWIATSAISNGMAIMSPQNQDVLSSPVTVKGNGIAFEGVIGKIKILDHLYTDIGNAQVKGANGMGNTTFTTTVNYTSSFKNGSQEGLLVLYSYSNANGAIAGVVMEKELLAI